MKTLILFITTTLLTFAAAAQSITVSVGSDNRSLEIKNAQGITKLNLDIPKGMALDGEPRVFGGGDFNIVLSIVADHEVSTTLIYALNGQGKKIWFVDLEAFNPSAPLIENEAVYLAGIGRVLKVDKKSGKVIWFHEGLYENPNIRFNGGEMILRKDTIIQFSEKVKVEDRSGRLLEVKK